MKKEEEELKKYLLLILIPFSKTKGKAPFGGYSYILQYQQFINLFIVYPYKGGQGDQMIVPYAIKNKYVVQITCYMV